MRSEGNLPELGEARRRGWGMAAAAPPLWWSRIWWSRRESRRAAVCFVREGRGGEQGRRHRWRERRLLPRASRRRQRRSSPAATGLSARRRGEWRSVAVCEKVRGGWLSVGNPKCHIYTRAVIGLPLGRLGQAFFRDGPCNMPASVNIFTEADNLKCPPRLIAINRGRHFKLPASVNMFSVAGKSDRHGK